MSSKLVLAILLLLVSSQAVTTYSYSDIKGKILSLKSRQKGQWLKHNGQLQQEGPYDTNSASIRFQVEEYDSDEFYLRSRQNNLLVSRKNSNAQLESSSNLYDRFKLQTKESHNIFYSSRSNRYISTSPNNENVYIIYYGNLDWNTRHQQWEILIHECPDGQAYKNDGSGQCVSSCEADEYMGDYNCEKCSDGCDRCTKSNDCQSCLGTHVFLGNTCVVSTTFTNQYIAIKSNRGNDFLRDRGNDVVKSDQGSIGNEERFTFERAHNGLVSIKGGKNSKYCQDNNDQLYCNDNYRFSDALWKIYKNSDGTYSFQNDASGKFMRTAEKTKKVMWWTEHKYYYIKVDRNSIGSHEKYKLTFDS